ncbi:P2X purinoceptor 3 isoform 4-T4 [Guaruba guarouba]
MPAPRRCPPWAMQFFSYETPKSVVVRSWVMGAMHRAVQLLILAYFIGWVFLHEKAYQVRDTAIESSVVTKVKGIGRYAGRVLDTADYVTPPQGTSVFVVVTKQILTEQQAQGLCPESEAAFRCRSDRDCRDRSPTSGSGLLTGRCVPYNGTLRTCEIRGWCPPEVDTVDVPIMLEAENFTLFIKNSIRFPLFGFENSNRSAPSCASETWCGSRGRISARWPPPGGCWPSRSGGFATWTAAGSAACPATPSPAWTGCPTPPVTTSGTPGTTTARTAPSAAPSPKPSASALTCWCREVRHRPHPHQHSGRVHLHWCGELWLFSAPSWQHHPRGWEEPPIPKRGLGRGPEHPIGVGQSGNDAP